MDGGWAKWLAEGKEVTPDCPCPLKVFHCRTHPVYIAQLVDGTKLVFPRLRVCVCSRVYQVSEKKCLHAPPFQTNAAATAFLFSASASVGCVILRAWVV